MLDGLFLLHHSSVDLTLAIIRHTFLVLVFVLQLFSMIVLVTSSEICRNLDSFIVDLL